jgi:hypothetical protein
MLLNPERLREIGQALFGDQWKGPLAMALNVSDKTMREWQHDDAQIPLGVLDELRDLCAERVHLIQTTIDRVASGGAVGVQTQVYGTMRKPGEFRKR